VRTNAYIHHGGLPLDTSINWSCSSQRSPALYYIISWRPSTSIPIYWHPIMCWFVFLLLSVLRTIFNCAFRVIFSVAAFAASQWTKWCLRCHCVSAGDVLENVPIVLLDSDPLVSCCAFSWSMICLGRCEEKDDNKKKWEVLRKMIIKRSGKSWAIYSKPHIKIDWVTAILHVLRKMNSAAHSSRWHGFQTVLRFASSQADVLCLFTGINLGELPPKSCVCEMYTAHCLTDGTSAVVCLQQSPESYME